MGSIGRNGVLPSARHTIVETSATATEAILKNNAVIQTNNIVVFIFGSFQIGFLTPCLNMGKTWGRLSIQNCCGSSIPPLKLLIYIFNKNCIIPSSSAQVKALKRVNDKGFHHRRMFDIEVEKI